MIDDSQAPPGIDASVATAARMYDYWLGGHDNFAADRIAEFLDLGTGLPTRGNVHQVAEQQNPQARVVYADNDPMVLAHSRALKTGAGTAVIQADMREPDILLGHPDTRRLIDFGRPVAVLFVAVLHFISDADRPRAIVSRFLDAAAPGSYLVISHATTDPSPKAAANVTAVYAATSNPATPRSHAEILAFFDDVDLIEPGLVPVSQWRPDEPEPADPGKQWILGGVGRKFA